MCRYCSHLKDLRKSEKEFYQGLIMKWKKVCKRQEILLDKCLVYLSFPSDEVGFMSRKVLADEILKEIRKDCV